MDKYLVFKQLPPEAGATIRTFDPLTGKTYAKREYTTNMLQVGEVLASSGAAAIKIAKALPIFAGEVGLAKSPVVQNISRDVRQLEKAYYDGWN